MHIADANVVLRYLLNDDEALAQAAREIIESDAVWIPGEVFCEVVFVLQKVYGAPRNEIAELLRDFVDSTGIVLNDEIVWYKALEFFSASNLDFVDCLLAGYNAVEGAQVHTFDKKLGNFIARLSP
ncbi:MAG: type II toxin-antitoxin system VapC family toxin [Azoarcus sp.]|jgi:predicted nucleic-acid-binding protein|nr:type II toxin-antitoxin system VapC family toxin [Azoarcus sp.]